MNVIEDKTKLYTFEEALRAYDKITPPQLTASEIVLLLLNSYDKPIYGRTLFMKEVFLLNEEILRKHYENTSLEDLHYVPFRFGMYSFKIAELLKDLELAGYIERRGKKNTRNESFVLTKRGSVYAKGRLCKIPERVIEKVRSYRKGWDELGTDGILRYAYEHYPEFIDKSELKKKYKGITWGRGRG